MALSSSLFSGISGLGTLGSAMQIIGDNIANVNTVGFKSSTYSFQDLLSQNMATRSGGAQVGRGAAIGDITSSFEQGSFESTNSPTDLAIGGNGFFTVKETDSDRLFYTRAGNFSFNKEGYLVNPEGYIVQGWAIDNNGEDEGTITDTLLSSFTSSPDATGDIEVITNVDSDGLDGSAGADTSLATAWDGTADPPLATTAYEYHSTLKIYDSLGSSHDISVYFDKADTASTYEYIVTCNPDEDKRAAGTVDGSGLMARGTITFTAGTGEISAYSMDILSEAGVVTARDEAVPADLTDGHFCFDAQFIDGGVAQSIELDFGIRYDGAAWAPASLATSSFASASKTVYQASDGYGAGDLQEFSVDVDGVITGTYSNGELIPLYRVALAKFTNDQGLYKEGGNLYSETRESGQAITNKPGTNGLGNIAPNSLEQSNVDIATEFVKMITTQRGFQANSKMITVTDQMLSELIAMKR